MNSPITPPPGLVQQWAAEARSETFATQHLCNQAAQWGADQELEACCQALRVRGTRMRCMEANQTIEHLRAARRPKPPSLKEQALDELDRVPTHDNEGRTVGVDVSIIRRALEQLPDAL